MSNENLMTLLRDRLGSPLASKILAVAILLLSVFIGFLLVRFPRHAPERSAIDLKEPRISQEEMTTSGKPDSNSPAIVTLNAKDYSSLQDAIDSLPSEGGVLYMPAGTYIINKTVKLVSGLTIVGDGSTTKIVAADSLQAHIFCPKTTSISDVTIKNLLIDGNKTGQDSGTDGILGISDGIYLNGRDFVVEGVQVHDTYGEGIALHNAKNVRIADCSIYNSRELNAGIALSGACSEIEIVDSGVINNGRNITITNGSNISIRNVTSSGAKFDGIEIASGNSNVEIIGGMHSMNMYTGIGIARDVKDCRISMAIIHSNGRAGIGVFAADEIKISNCVLFNNSAVDEGRPAIAIRGDEAKGCSNINIEHNRAFDGRSKKTQTYGVDNRWDTEGDYITLVDNDFSGNLEGDINLIYGSHNKTDDSSRS